MTIGKPLVERLRFYVITTHYIRSKQYIYAFHAADCFFRHILLYKIRIDISSLSISTISHSLSMYQLILDVTETNNKPWQHSNNENEIKNENLTSPLSTIYWHLKKNEKRNYDRMVIECFFYIITYRHESTSWLFDISTLDDLRINIFCSEIGVVFICQILIYYKTEKNGKSKLKVG